MTDTTLPHANSAGNTLAGTALALPAEFADLAPLAAWILPTEKARFAKRVASPMSELQAFYDTAFARFQAAADYLEQVSLDGISDEDKHLLWLYASLVTVSFAVECWRQPTVPDSGPSSIDEVFAPAV